MSSKRRGVKSRTVPGSAEETPVAARSCSPSSLYFNSRVISQNNSAEFVEKTLEARLAVLESSESAGDDIALPPRDGEGPAGSTTLRTLHLHAQSIPCQPGCTVRAVPPLYAIESDPHAAKIAMLQGRIHDLQCSGSNEGGGHFFAEGTALFARHAVT